MGNYEEETTSTETRKIRYIAGGDGLAAVFIMDNANPTGKIYYTYTDHLGSIVAITDPSGNLLAEQSFDPWGRRRNISDWSYTNVQAIALLDRGFTGHEHLNEFSLINMNGRLYDPVLGRMLSPDPYLQAPDYAQNFNKYSYCLNNPLRYTDPSGNLFIWDDVIVGAVGFAAGYLSHGFSTGNWGWDAVKAGAIGAGTALLGYYTGGGGLYLGGNGMMGASFTQMMGAFNYTVNMGIGSLINNFIPPLSIGNDNYNLSISPSFMNGKLGLSFTNTFTLGDFKFSLGKNTAGDLYYGASAKVSKNVALSWYRTDFGGDMPQGVAGIGVSGKNWSFNIDEDLGKFGGDGHDRYRTGAWQATWNDFVIGSRVITNNDDDYSDEATLPCYTNVRTGKVFEPRNGKGILEFGQVWSSPLMIGYKSKYGITAFEWNNPRHQQFLQNRLIHSWHGDSYFQAEHYNSFSLKSYRQNPFSIYFY